MAIDETFDYDSIDTFRIIFTLDTAELLKNVTALYSTPAQCTNVNDVLTQLDEIVGDVARGTDNAHDMASNIVNGEDLAYSIDIMESCVIDASDFLKKYIDLRRKLDNLLPASAAENIGVTDSLREQITDIWDDVTYNEDNILKYFTLVDEWWNKYAEEISRLKNQES